MVGERASRAFEDLASGGLAGAEAGAWDLFQAAWPEVLGRLEVFLRARRVPRELAEDCGQAVLVRVWRFRRSYRGSTAAELAAWMYRITDNEASRSLARRAGDERVAASEDPRQAEPAADEPTARELAEERDDRRALAECLDALEPRQREVVELLYADDPRSEREAVEVLGVSKSYVNVLRRKALEQLARCLESKGVG